MKSKHWRFRLLPVVSISALMVVLMEPEMPAQTEFGRGNPTGEAQFRNFAVPENRTASDIFDDAQRFLGEKRYISALQAFQHLLDHYGNKVVPVPAGTPGDCLYHGLNWEVNSILAGLGPEGYKAYHSLYNGPASRMLLKAADARTPEALLEVVKRYRHTSSGASALEALGDVLLERGEYLSSAHFYTLLATSQDPEEQKKFNLLKLIQALVLAGRFEEAVQVGRRLDKQSGSAKVWLNGRRMSPESLIEEWAKDAPPPSDRDGWPAFGGNADHTRLMAACRTVNRCEWQRGLNVAFEFDISQPYTLDHPAPFHPVAGRGKVFLHNGLRVWAFNLSDGMTRWTFPGLVSRSTDQPNSRIVFSGALHGEHYFANLEVRVNTPEHYYHAIPIQKKIPMRKLFAFHADTGKLEWSHAAGHMPTFLSREDRKFLSRVNIPSPPTAWSGTLYCGASSFEGKIYCYLTAIDAATGRLKWRTLICTGQKILNMFGRPMQEPVLGVPAVKDGVAYFATNLGVVAAVDARLGKILWLSTYPQKKIHARYAMSDFSPPIGWHLSPTIVKDGVVVTTPTDSDRMIGFDAESGRKLWSVQRQGHVMLKYLLGVRDGAVFASGNGVAAFSLKTGEEMWPPVQFPSKTEHFSWRGAVTTEAILIPTGRNLHVFDPVKGTPLVEPIPWDTPLDHHGNILVAGEDLLVTTTPLISTRLSQVNVFYNRRKRIRRLRERVRKRPEDPAPRLALARTLAQNNLTAEAEIQFQKAITVARKLKDRHGRGMLDEALRGRFDVLSRLGKRATEQNRFREAQAWIDRAVATAQGQPFHIDALMLKESLLRRQADLDKLAVFYAHLKEYHPERLYTFQDWGKIPMGLYARLQASEVLRSMGKPRRAVDEMQEIIQHYPDQVLPVTRKKARQYAVSFLNNLIERHGRSIYARYDDKAENLYHLGVTGKRSAPLLQAITAYPNASIIGRCLLAYAARARQDGKAAEAILTLRKFFLVSGKSLKASSKTPKAAASLTTTRAEALVELIEAYGDLGFRDASRDLLDRLIREYGDTHFTVMGKSTTGRTFHAARYRKVPTPAPFRDADGGNPVPVWSRPFSDNLQIQVLEQSTPSRCWNLFLVTTGDRNTGEAALHAFRIKVPPEEVWQVALPEVPGRPGQFRTTHTDGLLILPMNRHVVALDADSGAIRWKKKYEHRTVYGVVVREGLAITVSSPPPLGSGSASQYRHPVVEAIEIATGETVWSRRMEGTFPLAPLAAGGRVVVTMRRKPAALYMVDLLSSQLSGQRSLTNSFLDLAPIVAGPDRVLYSPDSRSDLHSNLEMTSTLGEKPLWKKSFRIARIETLIQGCRDSLVIASTSQKTGRPPKDPGRKDVLHIFAVNPEKPDPRWHVKLDSGFSLDEDSVLEENGGWILPLLDEAGCTVLKAIDENGRETWETGNLFTRNTFLVSLSRVLGGVMLFGYDCKARERRERATAHLVLVNTRKGKVMDRWSLKEPTQPLGKGVWPTETGFFMAWADRIEYHELKTGNNR